MHTPAVTAASPCSGIVSASTSATIRREKLMDIRFGFYRRQFDAVPGEAVPRQDSSWRPKGFHGGFVPYQQFQTCIGACKRLRADARSASQDLPGAVVTGGARDAAARV